jgi:LacI family transcriptional regulator
VKHCSKGCEKTPIAILNGHIEGDSIYSVLSDDSTGIETAVEHLVELGRKNLVCIHDSRNPAALSKMDGYLKVAARFGLDVHTIESRPGVEGALNACERGLRDEWKTDGIVCAEDPLAIGAMKYLSRRGHRVPEDVAVTGYDNLAFATCATPELTSVDGRAD